MKITKLQIQNYRNLNGISIDLEEQCNFIVGENSLGKSNLLTLLNSLFSARAYPLPDFTDSSKPLVIIVTLSLEDVEIGHFEDLFDLSDYSSINVRCYQENPDENIVFSHLESGSFISQAKMRALNFVYYDSLRNPVTEIAFDKGKGAGKFLRFIIANYLKSKNLTDSDFLKAPDIKALLKHLNSKISQLKTFTDYGIIAMQEDDPESLLTKLITFKDPNKQSLSQAGHGVQFMILITLAILEKIHYIMNMRQERGVFESSTGGQKSISLILALDEPEIHLHPYMQRALMSYLSDIINNRNQEFQKLIKDLFDIDRFIGQILVVTHSPNIILNDYRQIVRFYSRRRATKVISGKNIVLDEQLHKHLLLHFPFIKESFFSRCIIFVEGDGEYASFPGFAQSLGINFDELGICVIQARGDGVELLLKVANKFGLASVGINDKDKRTTPTTLPNHLLTTKQDFEDEIVSLIETGNEATLRKILLDYDTQGDERKMDAKALNKRAFRKYGIVSQEFTTDLILKGISPQDRPNLKSYYLTWFGINKGYPLGKLIGQNLAKEHIPSVYQTILKKAARIVTSNK